MLVIDAKKADKLVFDPKIEDLTFDNVQKNYKTLIKQITQNFTKCRVKI